MIEERLAGGNESGAVRVGDTVRRPAGPWTRSVHALLRHLEAVGFDEHGREVLTCLPGDTVGTARPWPAGVHSDEAPYNAAWADGRLVGFFDWDLAAPVTREWDMAFTAFGWVPLHARHVVAEEGFAAFADRPRRLRLFLETYRWDGRLDDFVAIVRERVSASVEGIRRNAAAGDPAYQRMIERGNDADLATAVAERADFPAV